MDISEQLIELNIIKASIKAAIETKGVTIPAGASFASFADYIEEIPSGGGGGGSNIIKDNVNRIVTTQLIPPSINTGNVNRTITDTISYEVYTPWKIHGTLQRDSNDWVLCDVYIDSNYIYNALVAQIEPTDNMTLNFNIKTSQVYEQHVPYQAIVGVQTGDNKFAIGLDGINKRWVLVDKRSGYAESSCTTYGNSNEVQPMTQYNVNIEFNQGAVTLTYKEIGTSAIQETIQATMSNECVLQFGRGYTGDSSWDGFEGSMDIDTMSLVDNN